MSTNNKKHWRIKPSMLRAIVLGIIVLLVVIGLFFHTGWGTPSAMGIDYIAAICPLGALETLFGTWAFVPRLLIVLAAILLIAFLFGRAFCSWICPVPPLSRLFSTKKTRAREASEHRDAARVALSRYQDKETAPKREALDSRHVVLCGALGSAAIFGFPVFCLVCPIGLTFATIIVFARLIGFNEPSWGLLIFPLIIVLELTVLRKWCSKICPIGALLSLIGRINRTFRPSVDTTKCLRHTKGEPCSTCVSTCPEHIDPNANLGLASVSECTRCKRCAESCPQGAISFPFIAPKQEKEQKQD